MSSFVADSWNLHDKESNGALIIEYNVVFNDEVGLIQKYDTFWVLYATLKMNHILE